MSCLLSVICKNCDVTGFSSGLVRERTSEPTKLVSMTPDILAARRDHATQRVLAPLVIQSHSAGLLPALTCAAEAPGAMC